MESSKNKEPQYRNEAAIFRQYVNKLDELVDNRCAVQGLIERDSSGVVSKAWRIIVNPTPNPEQVKIGGIFDWDDTLEPYTERKVKFYDSFAGLLPEDKKDLAPRIIKICKALNKAARILPENGTHPEHYTPRLELMALTSLLDSVKSGGLPETLIAVTEQSDKGDDEAVVREFIRTQVLKKLNGQVAVKEEIKDNTQKSYFMEVANQSISLNPNEKPNEVDGTIWNLYRKFMMTPNIQDGEFQNFDLSPDIRFIVATFGEASFQLEKVTNSIGELKTRGQRIPDEILIFLRGRKEPIIKKVVSSFPKAKFVYVDDSPRQVDKLMNTERIIPIHAVREGSKRSSEKADPKIRVVDMTSTKLSEIVDRNL